MHVKVFHAFTMQEAIRSIKAELGPDAVILSTKDVRQRGPMAKWFGRPLIEVTAAVERTPPAAVSRQSDPKQAEVSRDHPPDPSIVPRSRFQATLDGLIHDAPAPTLTPPQQPAETAPPARSPRCAPARVPRLDRVKAELRGLHQHLVEAYPEDLIPTPATIPPAMTVLFRDLVGRGLALRTAVSFVQTLHARLGEGCADPARLRAAFRSLVKQELADAVAPVPDDRRRVSLFFGPSGVGKTTVIAKLAARHVTEHRRSVALLTLDSYRAAAVEQLRSYADAMDIPMEAALTRQDAAEALRRLSDVDVILIDSGGRACTESGYLQDVRWLTQLDMAVETHLVLSAATKEADQSRLLARCEETPVSRLLFTKLDETSSVGTVLTLVQKSRIPLSYFSIGPRVPHDVESASADRLADLLLDGGFRENRDLGDSLKRVASESLGVAMRDVEAVRIQGGAKE
ncbi:MAG TPA: flagellar biosynthesis protein FlhF [Nitrospira sp.]|nr:flagellar biosynthesis protein FlhF [Nitrospira sp.]